MSSIVNELFTEKFRPKDLNSLIAPLRIKNEISKGLIQNILLYGHPGCGKSSALFILSKGYDTLYINARAEANIDLVRNRVTSFCSTISLLEGKEKLKCVLIDEMEGASNSFFDSIKVPIEKYAKLARFIGATNFIQKIPEGVLSRFNCISFDAINSEEESYLIQEYKKRVGLIMNAAKISYTNEVMDKFIRNYFPDMRSILNKLQSFYLQGVRELNDTNFNISYDFEDLFKLCLSKADRPYENYKFIVSEYSTRIDEALDSLSKGFVEYIRINAPNKMDKIPMIIIAIAEHQAQRTLVIDPLVTLLSIVFKIQLIINN